MREHDRRDGSAICESKFRVASTTRASSTSSPTMASMAGAAAGEVEWAIGVARAFPSSVIRACMEKPT
jgi:hypothetical protein